MERRFHTGDAIFGASGSYWAETMRGCTPEGLIAEVVRVIDGDTVEVMFEDGTPDRLRLLGVDTPETYGQNKANDYGSITDVTCLDDWGHRATEFAVQELGACPIFLGKMASAGVANKGVTG